MQSTVYSSSLKSPPQLNYISSFFTIFMIQLDGTLLMMFNSLKDPKQRLLNRYKQLTEECSSYFRKWSNKIFLLNMDGWIKFCIELQRHQLGPFSKYSLPNEILCRPQGWCLLFDLPSVTDKHSRTPPLIA